MSKQNLFIPSSSEWPVLSIEGLSIKAFKQQFHHQESQFMVIVYKYT